MSKVLIVFLALSVCVYAFDETDYLDGTILRPGYENLQVIQKRTLSLNDYYLENQITGTPRVMLTQYQSNINPVDAEMFAGEFIDNNYSDFNISSKDFRLTSGKLVLDKFYFINLIQTYNGIKIKGSNLSIKATPEGKIFMHGGEVFNDIELNAAPSISEESARLNALSGIIFNSQTDEVKSHGLIILPLIYDDNIEYRLTYQFTIITQEPRADWQVFVDAHNGEVIWCENSIRYETVSGNVSGLMQPATPYDEMEPAPFANQHVIIDGSYLDTTNAEGDYSVEVSGSDPVDVVCFLEGAYLNVDNQIGQDAYFNDQVIPGSELDIFWDENNSTIPETNAYYHGQVVHDYIKEIDPELTAMDFQMTCRVNVSGSCNAYWSSYDSSINFYRQGGGCPNIAQIADVVYHEYGHGLTHLQYQAGGHDDPNGAMHEGFSDYIACLISDQPLVGRGFFGQGTHLRNLDNDNRYPDDWSGESHYDGLIIGGALWDLKLLLDDERPNYVDTLWQYAKYGYSSEFLGYFWDLVAVDDDDGDIENGTPHAYEIFYAFGDLHGIGPGASVDIEHTPVIDSEDSTSAYSVEATAVSMFSMDSGYVTIYYTTGDDFIEIEMVNTSGNDWQGEIPSQSYGTTVSYYIEAMDDIGLHSTSPEDAPDSLYSFYIGADIIPPSMEFVEGPPNTINLHGPYSRFAVWVWDIHDIDASSGQLHYQVNETEEVIVAMEMDPELDEFAFESLDIGQDLQQGDIVNYWFTCSDEANNPNTGRLPETGSFNFVVGENEFVDGFENGIDDWTIIETCWIHYDQQGYQSSSSIKTGYPQYENNTNSIIYLSTPFNLSDFDNVWLGFMHLNVIPEGDTCFVVASTDPSGPWAQFGGISGNSGWNMTYQEVEGFAGPGYDEVYVGFQFISDDSQTHIGILIDNVEIFVAQPTDIDFETPKPDHFVLNQNYPNPFNMNTIISFSLPASYSVKLAVFDILGRKVIQLLDSELDPGYHQVRWDGRNSNGVEVNTGMYFYRLEYGNLSEAKSMILIK